MNVIERAAMVADDWANSKTCRDDGTPCDCIRTAASISERIRALRCEFCEGLLIEHDKFGSCPDEW